MPGFLYRDEKIQLDEILPCQSKTLPTIPEGLLLAELPRKQQSQHPAQSQL
jgi:hypothetical protein